MSAIAKTLYFVRSAGQGIRHTPFVHAVAISTIAIALFTVGLARGGAQLLDGMLATLSSEVELTVYLKPEATPEEREALRSALAAQTGGPALHVPPDVALARLKESLGDLGSALDDLPNSPLPHSLEVRIPPERLDVPALEALAQKTRALPHVEAVDYGAEAVERLSALARAVRWGSLFALVVAGAATLFIVAATLQLAIYARRAEIEIQKLVGATNRFVKVPFLLEGLFQGLLGAGVALLALWALTEVAGPRAAALWRFFAGEDGRAHLLTPRLLAELVGTGALLGLGGSFVAVGRFLRI